MLSRGYSLLTIKSVSDDQRTIAGVATTPSVDRMGDIVDPLGATFARTIPLLLHHDSRLPVGLVTLQAPSADGIAFEAHLPDITEPGALRERVAEALQSIRAGLIKGVSIGFRAMEDGIERLKSGGLKFTKFEILELSLVSVPANQEASIHVIRSIDQPFLAASGVGQGQKQVGTAAVAAPVVRMVQKDAPTTMTNKSLSDQIAGFEATRQAKDAERKSLMDEAATKGETLDEAGAQKYDDLAAEIKSIDAHLARLREMETSNVAAAVEVKGANLQQAAAARGGQVISVKDNAPAGIGLARLAMAKVCSYLDHVPLREIVAERWPDDARLKNFVSKAAVPAGTTTNATWAGNLVYADNLASEFVEFLRPQTLVGRLPLRSVPFNIRFATQTTGAVAGWVGQGKAKPVTSFSTGNGSLGYTKIAAISVISQELARFSSPSAEMLVRDELAKAVIERLDVDFIDPAQAASSGVNPASITNGLTPMSSAGTSADNVRTDLQNLLEQFILNNMSASRVVLIMPETLALAASLLTNAFGQAEFPTLSPTGGTLRGIPVFTTQYAANQSGSGNLVIALDPNEIAIAADPGVDISVSTEASIEMSDAPSGNSDTPTAASLVSLWQTNSIGIKAERFVNWTKKRSSAVVFMDDVNWGSIGSPS